MQDKTITYEGKEYTIPARELLSLIARIEDVITLIEIQQTALRGTLKLAKLARAYTIVLNWVGVKANELDIYYSILKPRDGEGMNEALERASSVVTEIIGLMSPPKHLADAMSASGKAVPPVQKGSGAKSKKRSKRG